MKIFSVFILAALLLVGYPGSPKAADFGGYETSVGPRTCFLMIRSPILDLPTANEMEVEVEQRYQHSLEVSLADSTIASRSPRFDWSTEAKVACGKAIGYFRGREINGDMISKCDCYYGRMMRYVY